MRSPLATGASHGARILLIEDNEDLAFGLRNNLEIEGYRVDVASDGLGGLSRAREGVHDLVILDLMLPGMAGLKVLRTLRSEGSRLPVLILTAKGDEAEKVQGFRTGADDYVTKPFGVLELLARVEAILRRAGPAGRDGGRLERFGDIEIDTAARRVCRGGQDVALTPKEFDLLLALVRRRGAVASRSELLTEVWGYRTPVQSRTVDTHIAELRRKLEDNSSSPRWILTVPKAGYRLRSAGERG